MIVNLRLLKEYCCKIYGIKHVVSILKISREIVERFGCFVRRVSYHLDAVSLVYARVSPLEADLQ